MIIIFHASARIRQTQKQWLSWPTSGLSLQRLVPEWALVQINRGRERQPGLLLLQCWSDRSWFWPWTGSGVRGSRVTVMELLHRETWRQRTEPCRCQHCCHFPLKNYIFQLQSHVGSSLWGHKARLYIYGERFPFYRTEVLTVCHLGSWWCREEDQGRPGTSLRLGEDELGSEP